MKKKKNEPVYRIDCTYNNERLCIDVRDDLSLLQALSADKNLGLDPYTMTYLISIRRSMLLTADNVEDDVIKITSKSLSKVKDEILNADKLTKKQEKALKKKFKSKDKEDNEGKPKEPSEPKISIVERPLDEVDSDEEEQANTDETPEEENSDE